MYAAASSLHGAAIQRLARGYEADPDKRKDLLQEMHLELWKSFRLFDNRCSMRTWVYRVAHNVGASHVVRNRRLSSRLTDLETLEGETPRIPEAPVDRQLMAARIFDLIHCLNPLDRQIIMLYLEGEAAGPIAEVTGLSPANVGTKIHRIKKVLKQQYMEGAAHERP
ncbi:MAG: sigma-70 family RNA polymerase sigma factor [Candidatus Acidiferrales bacterium]